MATLVTPRWVAQETLARLEETLIAPQLFNRGYSSEWEGRKKGDTIDIKVPALFTAANHNGSTTTAQQATEGTVQLTLDHHVYVKVPITSKEWKLELEDFKTQVLDGATLALAQYVDREILTCAGKGFYTSVGTPGTPVSALADLNAINRRLSDQLVPPIGRNAIVNTETEEAILNISEVHSADRRGDSGVALENARMGRISNVSWFMDQNTYEHTPGTFEAGSPLVNGAVAAGATVMNIDGGVGVETISEGDLFTVPSQPGVQFVFTGDFVAAGGAITGATFSPAVPAGGISDNDAISISAAGGRSVAFAKNALAYAMVPLMPSPSAGNSSMVQDRGASIRATWDWDDQALSDSIVLDFLFGCKVVDPRLGTIIHS